MFFFKGIAPNTMLAKVCSDKNKPNGQYQILPNRQAVMDFIKDLPIRKVRFYMTFILYIYPLISEEIVKEDIFMEGISG